MKIRLNQINNSEFVAGVLAAITGAGFSGLLTDYIANSGYLGPTVFYLSGDQTSAGTKTFQVSPIVPYTGTLGSVAQRQWTLDQISGQVVALGVNLSANFITSTGNDIIFGQKTFTGVVNGLDPISSGNFATKFYVDSLSGAVTSTAANVTLQNVIYNSGTQHITGQKIFDSSPLVVSPTDPSGIVNKFYADNLTLAGTVYTTGDQIISGNKTFLQSPLIPLATLANQAVSKMQLDAGLAMANTNTGSFNGGVLSINGTSGASGNIFLQSAGTVQVIQCGSTFIVSGDTAASTQFYSARVNLLTGMSGFTFVFPTGFGTDNLPVIFGGIEANYASNPTRMFISHRISAVNPGNFSVEFSSGIPYGGYNFGFLAIPTLSGSGFFGLQGPVGPAASSLNSRGAWRAGLTYAPLDYLFLPDNNVSYSCNITHISDPTNKPTSTGNNYWTLFASGQQGPSGLWTYQGNYNTGTSYVYGNSTFFNDESFGYTGTTPIANVQPDSVTGGWTYIARKGNPGTFINSGIITGNFVNLSFFQDPVITGLALAEAFVSRTFFATGFALGAVQSGTQSFDGFSILTGRFYKRNLDNSVEYFKTFTFNTGINSFVSGNFSVPITGMQRIGIDILNSISGIQKFSIGIFGFGIN